MKVYTAQYDLKSMVGNPTNQVFRSWVWAVVKAIANAFEDLVSDLTLCFYLCVFTVYLTFYIYIPYCR
jgi:basic membrane lipoprotein Med (substrate-binding protein (PBP1-ABC) superfamily)